MPKKCFHTLLKVRYKYNYSTFCVIVLVPYYATVLSPWHYRTFNFPLFVPLPYFIRGSFVNFSTCRNKSRHKATFFSLVKTARSTIAAFQIILCQYLYNLDVLLDLLSHCSCLSPSCNIGHHSFLLDFILLFSRTVAIAVSLLLFSLLGCRAILASLRLF